MRVGQICWSPCGRFISGRGALEANSALRINELDRKMYEQILNMIDATRFDPNFWARFQINLALINQEQQEGL